MAIACFGVVLALLLAELGLHLAGSRLASNRLPLSYDLAAIDKIASGQALVRFDRDLGWMPTPDVIGLTQRVQFRHNHQGLRADREYSPAPARGIRRIAAYGDSYTYCDEQNVEDCWTDQLEAGLANSEVMNFGVSGYAPDQAWLRYQQGGASWQPCAVLIGMEVENINRVVNRFRPFYAPSTGIALAKPRYLVQGDQLVLLPNPAREPEDLKDPRWVEANLGPDDDWYFPGTFVANPFDRLQVVNLARTAVYQRDRQETVRWTTSRAERMYRPGSEALKVLVRVLLSFANQVSGDRATPVVLIFPTATEIIAARDGNPEPQAALLDELRQHDLPAIDFSGPLGDEARQSGLSKLVGQHLRPLGNTVVARTLVERLPALTASTCGQIR